MKPTAKAKENSSKKTPPQTVGKKETHTLITKLVQLLDNDWIIGEKVNGEEDSIEILATRLHNEANALDQSRFARTTQLDVEEPKIYNKAHTLPNGHEQLLSSWIPYARSKPGCSSLKKKCKQGIELWEENGCTK